MSENNKQSLLWWLITKIPLCGGYCADTRAPRDSCLGRFSNEETVPQPCLRRKFCRRFFEHNILLRSFGRLGFQWAERRRGSIMVTAFVVSSLGWAFTIAACCAYTNTDDAVRATFWGWGDVDGGSLLYYTGLQRVVFSGALESSGGEESPVAAANPNAVESLEWFHDNDDGAASMCDTSLAWHSSTHGGALVVSSKGSPVAHCGTCAAAMGGVTRLTLVSCLTQVFQMTTDLQRSTRYGDMNCQKAFGFSTSAYGLVSALASLVEFRRACGLRHTAPPWHKTTPLPVTVVGSSGEAASQVEVVYHAGPGYVLLFLAVLLKGFDALCHLVVPTPEVNHLPLGDKRAVEMHAAATRLRQGLITAVQPPGEKVTADPWEDLAEYMALATLGLTAAEKTWDHANAARNALVENAAAEARGSDVASGAPRTSTPEREKQPPPSAAAGGAEHGSGEATPSTGCGDGATEEAHGGADQENEKPVKYSSIGDAV